MFLLFLCVLSISNAIHHNTAAFPFLLQAPVNMINLIGAGRQYSYPGIFLQNKFRRGKSRFSNIEGGGTSN